MYGPEILSGLGSGGDVGYLYRSDEIWGCGSVLVLVPDLGGKIMRFSGTKKRPPEALSWDWWLVRVWIGYWIDINRYLIIANYSCQGGKRTTKNRDFFWLDPDQGYWLELGSIAWPRFQALFAVWKISEKSC